MHKLLLPILLLTLLIGGCGQPERANDRATAANIEIGDPERVALNVVAEQSGLSVDALTVIASEPRDFRNSSLDCPVAGRAYLQVITPGHQVIVVTGDQRFDVRVARGRGRICRDATAK